MAQSLQDTAEYTSVHWKDVRVSSSSVLRLFASSIEATTLSHARQTVQSLGPTWPSNVRKLMLEMFVSCSHRGTSLAFCRVWASKIVASLCTGVSDVA